MVQFPNVMDCSSKERSIVGRYHFIPNPSGVLSGFVAEVNPKATFVYENANDSRIYMIYCEETPELLPGDIWESLLSDALCRNAEVNLSTVCSPVLSNNAAAKVCADIQEIAVGVSKELFGWLIVSFIDNKMTILARCVQRLDTESMSESEEKIVLNRSVSQWASSDWEVRRNGSLPTKKPAWLIEGLGNSSWINLVLQAGCFQMDASVQIRGANNLDTSFSSNCSTMASPPASPVTTCEGGEFQRISDTVWRLDLVKDFDFTRTLRSKPFELPSGKEVSLVIKPAGALISITLHVSKIDKTAFSICLGGAKSGIKRFSGNSFDVLFHPKAVWGHSLLLEFHE